MQKGGVVDLFDEEIRHVGARDEPACPIARIGQRAIGVSLWPIGQDHGTRDHPLELAPADDTFLHVLVVIDAPQQQMKRRTIKKPAVAATVARPEARHADQPLDLSLLHCGDEHPRRFGEESRRLEDDFGPDRNAERLDDEIDSSHARFTVAISRASPAIFSSLGWSTGILRADCASARTECPASRAAFTASRPIPLLAPMIRTVVTASWVAPEWLGSHRTDISVTSPSWGRLRH